MMRVLLATAALLLALAAPAAADTITVDGSSPGRAYGGDGGLSAGASSRLLYDYKEPERSQILDYLFKPDYGMSSQILKVEIGGDTNSTDGSEASHERERGAVDCGRGYEWWLMKQAKARNPDIKLWGLEWGAPGWFDGGFWSQDNIDYILDWLSCAKQQGLHIDYIGGWNERGFDENWYIALHKALQENFPDVKIVAADSISQPWAVATAMRDNPEFKDAVDIVGVHDPCGQRSLYQHCPSSADALALDKPLWDSEQSSEGHDVGAGPLARAMNRQYIDGRMTANVNWALISAWYADLPIADTGLMLAENPWSGYYHVGKSIWVHAHTTQFTKIGWRYLDDASGYLSGGGSYVTLRSPDRGDWTTVVETMDASAPQTFDVDVTGGLSTGTVHEWSSDLDSSDPKDMFVHAGDLAGSDGHYTVTLQPGHVYTFTTTTGQHKGDAAPAAGPAEQMTLPTRESFDSYGNGKLARYFSDINGAFETAPCGGGRDGTCYRQQVTQKPIAWNGTGDMDATTVMGDPRWWGDYRMSTKALLEDADAVELLGRVDAQKGTRVSGYHLRVGRDGAWRLYTEDLFGDDVTLASGTVPLDASQWHRLALRFSGEDVAAWIDDTKVADVQDASHRTGQVGLRVAGFAHAQFDDVAVEPSAPSPAFVPHADMTASATSEHSANYRGYEYSVPNAIDDRPETMWSAEFDPPQPLPQAVTLDLGSVRPTQGLTYQPRLDANTNGMITGWHVDVSTDGSSYATVARGTWPVGTGTKVIAWPERSARYVRLVADATTGCPGKAPVAAELNVVSGGPAIAPTTATADGGGPAFEHTVPQSQMTATASSRYSDAYLPQYAIDGDCTTFWHSAPAATGPLPATLTLDLGGEYAVDGITYLPRQDGNPNGEITQWEVATSEDGTNWTTAATGTWSEDATVKAATWPAVNARYLRLTALAGHAGVASAAELEVAYRPGGAG